MKNKLINTLILLSIGLIIFYIDCATKSLVMGMFENGDGAFYEVNSYLNFVLTYNYGISFGMMNDTFYKQWMFMALTSAIVFVLFVWLLAARDRWVVVSLSIIIGGAVGNIYDRYAYGAVVDFIDFHIGLWHYPAFNIADSSIVSGVMLLMYLTRPRKLEVGKFA
jgi:signal peptidase II